MMLNVALVFLVFIGVNCDIEFPEEQYCPVVNSCHTPLLYNVKYRCAADIMCPIGYKCCRSDCYIHKVCVIAVNKNGDKIELPDVSTKTATEQFTDSVEELNKNATSVSTLSNDFDYSTPWDGNNTESTEEVVTHTTEAPNEETTSFSTEVTESFNTSTMSDFTDNLTEFPTKMSEETNPTETTFNTEVIKEFSSLSNEETATTTEASTTEDVTESFKTYEPDNITTASTKPPSTTTERSEWSTASTIFTDESTDDIIIFPNDSRLSTTKKNTAATTTEKYDGVVEGSGYSYTDDDEEEASGANEFTSTSGFNVVTDDESGTIDGSGSGYGPDTDDSILVFPDDDYPTSISQKSTADDDFTFDINFSTESVATKSNEISRDENTKHTDFPTEKQSTVEEGSGSEFIEGSGDDSEPGDVDEEVGTYSSHETTTGVSTIDVSYITSIVAGISTENEIDLIDFDSGNSFSSPTDLPKSESTIEGSGNGYTDTENGEVDEEVATDSFEYVAKVETTSTETIFTYAPLESDMIDLGSGNRSSSVTELAKTESSGNEMDTENDDVDEKVATNSSEYVTKLKTTTSSTSTEAIFAPSETDIIDLDSGNSSSSLLKTESTNETIEGSGNELTDTEHGDVDEEITTFESTDIKKYNLVTPGVIVTEDENEEDEEDDDDEVDEDIRNNFQHRIIRG